MVTGKSLMGAQICRFRIADHRQIYNQLMGYNLTAGIVAGDNAIFLVERQTEVVEDDVTGTCKTIGKLIVDGPLYMYPGVGQERFTPAMLYAYLGWATLVSLSNDLNDVPPQVLSRPLF